KNSDRAPGNISDGIPTVSVTNRKTNDEATVYPASKEEKGCLSAPLATILNGVRQPVGKASVDSRRSQQSLEQQPKQPVGLCSNILAITGSNRGDDTEDEASDTDSIHDPHSVEENQLLITAAAMHKAKAALEFLPLSFMAFNFYPCSRRCHANYSKVGATSPRFAAAASHISIFPLVLLPSDRALSPRFAAAFCFLRMGLVAQET
ncbi:hypothetical protein D5086_032629, partial [Populus alba]